MESAALLAAQSLDPLDKTLEGVVHERRCGSWVLGVCKDWLQSLRSLGRARGNRKYLRARCTHRNDLFYIFLPPSNMGVKTNDTILG